MSCNAVCGTRQATNWWLSLSLKKRSPTASTAIRYRE
jgi:hypothetical protein